MSSRDLAKAHEKFEFTICALMKHKETLKAADMAKEVFEERVFEESVWKEVFEREKERVFWGQ